MCTLPGRLTNLTRRSSGVQTTVTIAFSSHDENGITSHNSDVFAHDGHLGVLGVQAESLYGK